MLKFPIKNIKVDKYTPSNLKISKNFIRNVKKEASERQVVEIDGKKVIFGVEGPILLKNGIFWSISAYVENGRWGKHYILIFPDLKTLIERDGTFIRLNSGCMSSLFGDITCDCLEQLRIAEKIILKKGGIIIYIPDQDGRGWHEECKMANQRIMNETGLDTITAATKFYGKENIDIRTFDEAIMILKALGFPLKYRFNLGTKNPRKVNALKKAGFEISSQAIDINGKSKHLAKNLKAKYKFFDNHKKGQVNARD